MFWPMRQVAGYSDFRENVCKPPVCPALAVINIQRVLALANRCVESIPFAYGINIQIMLDQANQAHLIEINLVVQQCHLQCGCRL